MKIITAWKKLAAILADKKISREELPAFLEALAELLFGILELVTPFLKGPAAVTANRAAAYVKMASGELRK